MNIIFDADDTLWKTHEVYEQAKKKFAQLLQEQHDFNATKVLKRFEQIDNAAAHFLGFDANRFAHSMYYVYLNYCSENAVHTIPETEKKIWEIGTYVNSFVPELFVDTVTVLQELKRKHDLYVFTLGDFLVQLKKVFATQLADYFKLVTTVARKNVATLSSFLMYNNLKNYETMYIGNSLISDIAPALGCDIAKIFYLKHKDEWVYDTQIEIENTDVITVTSLSEALEIIKGTEL